MTLHMQFDDLTEMVTDLFVGVEPEFIETLVRSSKISDELRSVKEKISKVKKVVAKKEKRVHKLRSQVQHASVKLDDEKRKIKAVQEEKYALVKTIESIRYAVMQHNSSNAEILSMIDSASLSDIFEE